MGAALGCMATEAACCFTSAACRCFCKGLNCASSTATRAGYAILFLVNSVIAWIMLSDFVIKKLKDATHGYLKLNCEYCYGILAVQRICFALTLFHAVLALTMIGVKSSRDPRSGIQNGFWGPKILIWILLIVASFFIPNEFFITYSNYIALIGAGFFVLLQLLLLIDFAHTFAENILDRWENTGEKKYMVALIGSTVSLLILAVVLTGVMYGFFAAPGCNLNQFFITFNLILCFAAVMLAIAPAIQEYNSRSGLTQASIVVSYATYLIISAVSNEPPYENDDHHCNPLSHSKGSQTVTVVIGALFTFIAIVYSTSSAAVRGGSLIGDAEGRNDGDVESATPLIQSQPGPNPSLVAAVESGALPSSVLTNPDVDSNSKYPVDDETEGTSYNYSFFHIIFCLASMYVAMLLTDWNTVTAAASPPAEPVPTNPGNMPSFPWPGSGTDNGGNGGSDQGMLVEIGKSWAAVWVKVVSSWLVVLLYAWTLIAPVVMPDREWS
ncbi:serine incorporator/TMS membrane protein [Paraphysoderma sedebokerense]|nr:serine incorporator/TMS membrane protein [Paraphysoderma sedebokerense]